MAIYAVYAPVMDGEWSLVLRRSPRLFNGYMFKGKKVIDWQSLTLTWRKATLKNALQDRPNDIVHVFGAGMNLVVNQKVVDVFEPLLGDQAQFLPVNIQHESEPWYLINTLIVADHVLDVDASGYRMYRGEK